MTIRGIVASEQLNPKATTVADVVFQTDFEGTNGGQDAVDVSQHAATLWWYNNSALTSVQKKFGNTSLKIPSGASAQLSLITTPPNADYDIGVGDFTIEFFIQMTTLAASTPIVRAADFAADSRLPTGAHERWTVRIVGASLFFQWSSDGNIINTQNNGTGSLHGMNTGSWYHVAISRYFSTTRLFVGGVLQDKWLIVPKFSKTSVSHAGFGSGNPCLYIADTVNQGVSNGDEAFLDALRISKKAWYKTDASFTPPTVAWPLGIVDPLFTDSDVIYTHQIVNSGALVAPLHTDVDTFYTPVVGLNTQNISTDLIGATPTYVNSGALGSNSGSFNTAGPALPTSRTNGNLLVAFVYVIGDFHRGLTPVDLSPQNFTIGGGWTIGDQIIGDQAGEASFVWAYRFVDGTEVLPTFNWTGAASPIINGFWRGRVHQFSGVDSIGSTLSAADFSQYVLAAAGIATHRTNSMVLASYVLETQVTDPASPANALLPTGYTSITDDQNQVTMRAFREIVAAVGTSDPINLEVHSVNPWVLFMMELKGTVQAALVDTDTFYTQAIHASPTFVNANVTNGAVSVASGGPNLPSSRVVGNLLIAWICVTSGSKTFTLSAGWTLGDTSTDASSSSCWAYRVVDGTETVGPTFSWTGNATYHSRIFQFTNVHSGTPIGTKGTAQGNSASLSVPGITTTANLSMVFGIELVSASSQTIPTPTNYTATGSGVGGGPFADSNGSDRECYEYQPTIGTNHTMTSAITSAHWHGYLIEILGS